MLQGYQVGAPEPRGAAFKEIYFDYTAEELIKKIIAKQAQLKAQLAGPLPEYIRKIKERHEKMREAQRQLQKIEGIRHPRQLLPDLMGDEEDETTSEAGFYRQALRGSLHMLDVLLAEIEYAKGRQKTYTLTYGDVLFLSPNAAGEEGAN